MNDDLQRVIRAMRDNPNGNELHDYAAAAMRETRLIDAEALEAGHVTLEAPKDVRIGVDFACRWLTARAGK